MLQDKTGRRILRERPVVNSKTVRLNELEYYPKGSFGSEYYNFLASHKVTPDTRLQVLRLFSSE